MKEVIDRLLSERFEDENSSLDFSCANIELSIEKGQSVEGSFQIYAKEGSYTKGFVTSSDSRMEVITGQFVGNEEQIAYCFHGENVSEGEQIKGEFYIISNHGEYYLPFCISVSKKELTSSLGEVKNLFHFANLAKVSPEEAVSVFYSPDFVQILNGTDRQYREYYLGLSAYPYHEQNVEEFLIGIHKKQKIEYLIQPNTLTVDNPEEEEEQVLMITRNGWGYTELKITVEGDFLKISKEKLTEQDFMGNLCRLPVVIRTRALHAGNNYGAVLFTGSYDAIRVPVLVKHNGTLPGVRSRQEKKQITLQLMKLYLAFRMKKIGAASWAKESTRLTEEMLSLDEEDLYARLFQAQLLITAQRVNEAKWILDHVSVTLAQTAGEDTVLWAYYLYLTTLFSEDEAYVDRVTEKVERLYKKHREEWRLAWLLLYLSDEYNKSFSKKWMFLEEQFERGCVSPVLYTESLLLLNANPSLLNSLKTYEKQLLIFGARYELLSPDVIMQLTYLAGREKEYDSTLYRILVTCYETTPSDDLLQEICGQLIKGNCFGVEYLKWYKKGVEKGLRITRLYESYMMSLDVENVSIQEMEALPKMVLMYFSYQNSLNDKQAAYLYANTYKYREGYPELYQNYLLQMEQFLTGQLAKRRINRCLAYLYKNLLTPEMLTGTLTEDFAHIAFLHEIRMQKEDIRKVIVFDPGMKAGKSYPVYDGKALISLPDTESRIILEDSAQNRYMDSSFYVTEKLMIPGRLLTAVIPMTESSHDVNVYQCFAGQELLEITEDNVMQFERLFSDELAEDSLKREIGLKLLRFYFDKDHMQELDAYLEQMDLTFYNVPERNEILRYMVIRGLEETAYHWLMLLGPHGMDEKTIMRLCSRYIEKTEFAQDAVLTELVYYAFSHGKYDERCLRYLILYFEGTVRSLRDIWKAAVNFCVDTYELSEKILVQMLFSGAYVGEKMQIFKSYVAGGARPDVEKAFLAECAYEYFVNDKVTEAFIFEEIAAMRMRGDGVKKISKLSFVKYYAENPGDMKKDTPALLSDFIHELMNQGIVMKMFTAFPQITDTDILSLQDRTIVEYKAPAGTRVVIYYRFVTDEKNDSSYRVEDMQEVYGGVYTKDFVLFYGESLQYYIMETGRGEEQVTESATLRKNDTIVNEGRFGLINDISISCTMKDYATVDRLLTEYEEKEFLERGLFPLK